MGMINLTTNSFKNASAHANKNIGIKCVQVSLRMKGRIRNNEEV